MPDWIKLYQRLPYPLRVAVASGRGYYLRRWRYGVDTEQLIQQASERESWSLTQWQTWQEERLAYILHRAATHVPYYRDYWQHRRRQGDNASWELLNNWPVLAKQTVRDNPRQFLADDCQIDKMFCDRTSGTTGTPLPIWLSYDTNCQWYALLEARTRRWYGVSVHKDRWAILGGQLVVAGEATQPPYWVWNAGLNQLYMSVFHITPDTCQQFLEAIRRYRITHVVSYPSSLYVLARLAKEQGFIAPPLRFALTNAEALYPEWREVISEVFQCPVQSTYGMAELTLAAAECEHKTMHLWPETGVLEIFQPTDDAPQAPDQEGRFILTGLLNPDMPLIRYEVGDWGKGMEESGCACGRGLPVLSQIDGRTGDMLHTPDGRVIFWANNIFFGLNIREVQVVQEDLSHIELRVVPAPAYTLQDEQKLQDKMHQRIGPQVNVTVKLVDSIPRTANGKFRTVISHLPSWNPRHLDTSL